MHVAVLSVFYLAYVLMEIIVYEMLANDAENPCIPPELIPRYCLVFFVIIQTIFIAFGTSVSNATIMVV